MRPIPRRTDSRSTGELGATGHLGGSAVASFAPSQPERLARDPSMAWWTTLSTWSTFNSERVADVHGPDRLSRLTPFVGTRRGAETSNSRWFTSTAVLLGESRADRVPNGPILSPDRYPRERRPCEKDQSRPMPNVDVLRTFRQCLHCPRSTVASEFGSDRTRNHNWDRVATVGDLPAPDRWLCGAFIAQCAPAAGVSRSALPATRWTPDSAGLLAEREGSDGERDHNRMNRVERAAPRLNFSDAPRPRPCLLLRGSVLQRMDLL